MTIANRMLYRHRGHSETSTHYGAVNSAHNFPRQLRYGWPPSTVMSCYQSISTATGSRRKRPTCHGAHDSRLMQLPPAHRQQPMMIAPKLHPSNRPCPATPNIHTIPLPIAKDPKTRSALRFRAQGTQKPAATSHKPFPEQEANTLRVLASPRDHTSRIGGENETRCPEASASKDTQIVLSLAQHSCEACPKYQG